MAGAFATISIKDASGTSQTMRVWDESGTGSGPFSFAQYGSDGAGSGGQLALNSSLTAGVKLLDAGGTNQGKIDSHGSFVHTLVDSTGSAVTFNSNGQAAAANSAPVVLASDKGVQPQNFSVAASTLTRPANTTQYSVNDSISDNATAGSVTALSATLSDTNDSPINITHVIVDTNDTGIGAATTTLRAYLYNSDPTASTGVGAGDNAAFSNKRAGLVGTLTGSFIAMSDGGKAVLTPESGVPYIVAKPTSGAKTLFIQYQIIAGTPTPSANSTTLIGTICGFQGR